MIQQEQYYGLWENYVQRNVFTMVTNGVCVKTLKVI